jgi:hypothetical protein
MNAALLAVADGDIGWTVSVDSTVAGSPARRRSQEKGRHFGLSPMTMMPSDVPAAA